MNVRTSATHPLRIDWLEMPPGWRVGITIAPGKHTVSTEGFRWKRDLATDLHALIREGVGTLVCLLEREEMARLGIPDLLDRARDLGLGVIHSPIVDVSVPSTADANAVVSHLHASRERSIVIHCNGGLGRSGVVAGILLRALGVGAEETLRRLRSARRTRCPETDEQRQFVLNFIR